MSVISIVLNPVKTRTVNAGVQLWAANAICACFVKKSTPPMHVTLFPYRFLADAVSKDEGIRAGDLGKEDIVSTRHTQENAL